MVNTIKGKNKIYTINLLLIKYASLMIGILNL